MSHRHGIKRGVGGLGSIGVNFKMTYLSIITGCLLFVFKKSYAVNYHSFHIFAVFHGWPSDLYARKQSEVTY